MADNTFQWRDLAVGMVLKPEGWVLSRQVRSRTRGEQWLASRKDQPGEVLVYFPPASLVGDRVLFDEWQRRSRALLREGSSEFQRVMAVVTDASWPYCVIESVEGLDLSQFRLSQEHRLISTGQLTRWLAPLVPVLAKEHRAKRVHGSLSPDSLILEPGGRLKVVHHQWRALFCELEQRADESGASLLALPYLSPQQLDGRRLKPADDLYSLAATLYELLSSEPPFVRGDIAHQIRSTVPESITDRLADLDVEGAEISTQVDEALARCLSKDPKKRFSNLESFWRTFSSAAPSASHAEETGCGEALPINISHKAEPPRTRPGLKATVAAVTSDAPEDEIAEPAAGPYYPPPPMASGKRFGVVFAVCVVILIGVVAFLMDRHWESQIDRSTVFGEGVNSPPETVASATATTNAAGSATLASTEPEGGWLALRTEPVPAVAELWLATEEIPIESVTPTMFSNVPPGEVEIRLVATGYVETNLFTKIELGKTNRISVPLAVETGEVALVSEPRGVRYSIRRNDQEVRSGRCPDEFRLKVGLYQLDFALGDRKRTTFLRVDSKTPAMEAVEFPAGKLAVETEPEEAEVLLGGNLVGRSPLTLTNMVPGEHRLLLKAPRYRSVVVNARVQHNIETFVSETLEPLPGPASGEDWVNSLGMKFVPLDETSSLLATTEVTRAQYLQFARDTRGNSQVSKAWEAIVSDVSADRLTELPVVNVSATEAQAFCRWLSENERRKGLLLEGQRYRLPSDREWSMAIAPVDVGSGGSVYPWGTWPPLSNTENYGVIEIGTEDEPESVSDRFLQLAPVGQFAANRFGLFDLGGNAREWSYEEGVGGTMQWLARGASWRTSERAQLGSDYRMSLSVDDRADDLGFRVVIELDGASG